MYAKNKAEKTALFFFTEIFASKIFPPENFLALSETQDAEEWAFLSL